MASALAAIAFHPIEEADIFFHIILGRAVLENGTRTVPEPSAFVDFGAYCPVPAWLWDVAAYGIHGIGGANALIGVTILVAALIGFAICALVGEQEENRSLSTYVAVSGMACVCAASRIQVRPQVAFLLLVPCFLYLCYRYRAAEGRRRVVLGAVLVVVAVLWVQLHGSAILAPGLFFIIVFPRMMSAGLRASSLRADLLTFGGVLVALMTGTEGTGILSYVLSHSGDDIASHNLEMNPVDWATISPFGPPIAGALLALWILSLFGVRDREGYRISEIVLLIVGLVLLSQATRFSAAAGLLAIPLAVHGGRVLAGLLREIYAQRLKWAGAVVFALLSLLLLFNQARSAVDRAGPIGSGGWTAGAHPRAGAGFLTSHLMPGSNVISDYAAGPPLAFWSDNRLRTFVDGRTAMYFDATDYALARDTFLSMGSLERSVRRYGARAVVSRRENEICEILARRWVPVVIEPVHTTFVPAGTARPMAGLMPCGKRFAILPRCDNGGKELAETAAVFRRHDQPALAAQVEAARLLHCENQPSRALSTLPDDARVWKSRDENRTLRIEALLRLGKTERAFEEMMRALDHGDAGVLRVLADAGAGNLDGRRIMSFLKKAVRGLDDASRPGIRLKLAQLCIDHDDLECVRFHSFRAAIFGDRRAIPFLRLIIEAHPDKRAKQDARKWLEVLEQEP